MYALLLEDTSTLTTTCMCFP